MFTTRKKVHPYKKEIKSRIILNKEKRIIRAMNEFQELSDVKFWDTDGGEALGLGAEPLLIGAIKDSNINKVLNCYKLKKNISRKKYEIKKSPAIYSIQKLFETKVTVGVRRLRRPVQRKLAKKKPNSAVITPATTRASRAITNRANLPEGIGKSIKKKIAKAGKVKIITPWVASLAQPAGHNSFALNGLLTFQPKVSKMARSRPQRKQPILPACSYNHLRALPVKEDYFFKGFRKSKVPLKLINLFFPKMENIASEARDISNFSPLPSRAISIESPSSESPIKLLTAQEKEKKTERWKVDVPLSAQPKQSNLAPQPASVAKIKKILKFFILYKTIEKNFSIVTNDLKNPKWEKLGAKTQSSILSPFLITKRVGEERSPVQNYRNKNIILISQEKNRMGNEERKTVKGVGEIEAQTKRITRASANDPRIAEGGKATLLRLERQFIPFPYNPNLRITQELLNKIVILPPYKFEKLQDGEKINANYGDMEKKSQSALTEGINRLGAEAQALMGFFKKKPSLILHKGSFINPRGGKKEENKGYKMGVSLKITPDKIGYKLGEFLKTRKDPIIKIKKKK